MMMKVQTLEQFVNEMANQYTIQFNVYRDQKVGNIDLDFYAEYQRRDEKYLMSKSIKVWSVENQQYVFVKSQEKSVTKEDIRLFAKEIDRHIQSFVPEKREHMSTYFIGIIITNQDMEKEAIKEINKARKLRFVKFGWHGWTDRYIGVVQLKDRKVYVNSKGREFVKGFEEVLKKKGENI